MTDKMLSLFEIFFPHTDERATDMTEKGGLFAHYTTASTALKILGGSMLMRNTAVMNDALEVQHGLDCLQSALSSDVCTAFRSAMDDCFPGLFSKVREDVDTWIPTILQDTYVTCVSEHHPIDREFGRLSMWRAYGADTGVALILNGGPIAQLEIDRHGAMACPVAYLRPSEFVERFAGIADAVRKNRNSIIAHGLDRVSRALRLFFWFAMVGTKHKAFEEEREWRLVASPKIFGTESILRPQVLDLGGVPQNVFHIDLKNQPERHVIGLAPDAFVDHILVGPTEHAHIIRRALVDTLKKLNFRSPEERVICTGIPLRPNQR